MSQVALSQVLIKYEAGGPLAKSVALLQLLHQIGSTFLSTQPKQLVWDSGLPPT